MWCASKRETRGGELLQTAALTFAGFARVFLARSTGEEKEPLEGFRKSSGC